MMIRKLLCLLAWLLPATVAADIDFSRADAAPGNMRFAWIHGSLSAKANTDVRVQVHRYNEHTYILRQNPAVHWEAPFMYLLIGNKRAVLLDAGATEEPSTFPLREVVDDVLIRWQQANGVEQLELVVLPLGSDASQTAGLSQFADRADTTVVETREAARAEWLGSEWPSRGTLSLGGRSIELIPTPGLDDAAISAYDPWADLLFTGNAFYPGRLVIRDFAAYRNSLQRLVAFQEAHPIAWIAGGRIEMSDTPGLDYILRSNFRPRERALQLAPDALRTGLSIVELMNGKEDIHIHDDFIVMHGVGRGARAYGWPVFIPERFDKPRPR